MHSYRPPPSRRGSLSTSEAPRPRLVAVKKMSRRACSVGLACPSLSPWAPSSSHKGEILVGSLCRDSHQSTRCRGQTRTSQLRRDRRQRPARELTEAQSESQLSSHDLRTLVRFGKREHAGASTSSLTQECQSVRSRIHHELLPTWTIRMFAVSSLWYRCGNRAWALARKGGRSRYTSICWLSAYLRSPCIAASQEQVGRRRAVQRSSLLLESHSLQFPEDWPRLMYIDAALS